MRGTWGTEWRSIFLWFFLDQCDVPCFGQFGLCWFRWLLMYLVFSFHMFKAFDVVSLAFAKQIANCEPVNFCMCSKENLFVFGLMSFCSRVPEVVAAGFLYESRGLEVIGSDWKWLEVIGSDWKWLGLRNGQPSDVAGLDVFGVPQKALWPWLRDWHCDRELWQLRKDAANSWTFGGKDAFAELCKAGASQAGQMWTLCLQQQRNGVLVWRWVSLLPSLHSGTSAKKSESKILHGKGSPKGEEVWPSTRSSFMHGYEAWYEQKRVEELMRSSYMYTVYKSES